jgi:predicted porin
MNKKLIALAVAGAFAPAMAMAQGTNVTIYGTFNGAWNYVEAKGATALVVGAPASIAVFGGANIDGRSRVDIDSSNIGFRVKEDLGGGLGAWGQCESNADFSAGGSTLCSRNSGVGLEGAFGNVFIGQWDTPYKQQGAIDVMGNTHIIAWVGIMSSPGFNVASTTGGNGTGTAPGSTLSFDRRQSNTLNYYTPNWNGFQAKFAVSANEEKPADPTPAQATVITSVAAAGLDPFMYSLSIGYDSGPFYANLAYEQHDDFGGNILAIPGTVSGTDDSAWRLALGYKFGNFRFTGAYERIEYNTDAITAGAVANTGDVERDAWYIGGSYTAGPHYFALSYADADDLDCSGTVAGTFIAQTLCNNTAARSYAAKYAYSLSKRTELFAHYVKIRNDQAASYTFGVNALTTVAPGADPEGFGVGVKHTF